MKKTNPFLLCAATILACIFFSCKHRYQSKIESINTDPLKEVFIEANKQMIINEEKKIDSLISFLDFPFLKDETGVRIHIDDSMQNILGLSPMDGQDVFVAYNCVVFDDYHVAFDNTFVDTLSFKIGYSKQMRGLNYAIKLLKVGDKAKIIIPSYLGFGMSGYGKSVPPYSTLFLNVKLLNIQE